MMLFLIFIFILLPYVLLTYYELILQNLREIPFSYCEVLDCLSPIMQKISLMCFGIKLFGKRQSYIKSAVLSTHNYSYFHKCI